MARVISVIQGSSGFKHLIRLVIVSAFAYKNGRIREFETLKFFFERYPEIDIYRVLAMRLVIVSAFAYKNGRIREFETLKFFFVRYPEIDIFRVLAIRLVIVTAFKHKMGRFEII